jgi:hypothetical protein
VLLALTAWLIGAVCVAAGARRLTKVGAFATDAEALLADLRRALRAGRSWSESPRVARELGPVLAAPSPEAAVGELNERLSEVSRGLAVGAEIPRAGARIGLFSGAVLSVVELIRTLGGPAGVALGTAGAALLAGLTGAVIGFELDRRARKAAGRCREAWNAISSTLARRSGVPGSEVQISGRGISPP